MNVVKREPAPWWGYDSYVDGRFVAGHLVAVDQDIEPGLRGVRRFDRPGRAERVAVALNGGGDDAR